MEAWASRIPQARFLCVCVESLEVAKLFDRMFGFVHAMNAYIPARTYFPVGYGQLGCSGFIISDSKGNFVSRRTKAFLQYGEAAFRDVEKILKPLIAQVPPAAPAVTPKRAAEEEEEKKEAAPSKKQKETTTTNEAAVVDKEQVDTRPPILGIASMDDEHESCAEALEALLGDPTKENLVTVLKELQKHFAHEEALMIQHKFGGDPVDSFSGLTSHVKDHKRILNLVQQELDEIQELSCCTT